MDRQIYVVFFSKKNTTSHQLADQRTTDLSKTHSGLLSKVVIIPPPHLQKKTSSTLLTLQLACNITIHIYSSWSLLEAIGGNSHLGAWQFHQIYVVMTYLVLQCYVVCCGPPSSLIPRETLKMHGPWKRSNVGSLDSIIDLQFSRFYDFGAIVSIAKANSERERERDTHRERERERHFLISTRDSFAICEMMPSPSPWRGFKLIFFVGRETQKERDECSSVGKVPQWRPGGHGFNPYIPQWHLVN